LEATILETSDVILRNVGLPDPQPRRVGWKMAVICLETSPPPTVFVL
jgi:hypothetical protein